MKKLILVLAVISLATACKKEKDYICRSKYYNISQGENSANWVGDYVFTGTKEEKAAYEEKNTKTIGSMQLVTECN